MLDSTNSLCLTENPTLITSSKCMGAFEQFTLKEKGNVSVIYRYDDKVLIA